MALWCSIGREEFFIILVLIAFYFDILMDISLTSNELLFPHTSMYNSSALTIILPSQRRKLLLIKALKLH